MSLKRLRYREKLFLYTYVCREFPSVTFRANLSEEELEKALLSFFLSFEEKPWELFSDNFIKEIDKSLLVRILSKILDNSKLYYRYYDYEQREQMKRLLNNFIQFTEEKQKEFSKEEEESLSDEAKQRIENVLAKLDDLRKEGKIKI